MLRNASWCSFVLGASLLFAAAPALAQDKSSSDAKKDDSKKDDSKKDDSKKDDSKKDDSKASASEDALDPFEDPTKTYRFIGLRLREAVASQWIMQLFAHGGTTVGVPMIGPEFISRHDHLEIAVALMYADYGMNPALFQGKSDPPTSWEFIASTMKLGYAMIDFMYEVPIEKKGDKTGRVAFLVGGGFGIAGVFGQLYRSQAYPNTPQSAASGDISGWSACTGPGTQNTAALPKNLSGSYCDTRTNHYAGVGGVVTNGFQEPNWAGGASKPLIFPWIALPQFAIRYKPIKQFQTKFDFGFSTTGFWFGISASYGIPTN
jgi:hypothetical protein